ncbi:GNAT family N-acetyltransferase [Bradyrhizobium erythrophlei]|uniref:GNAT family N-acetyltransferase n=1 Tax=Bradyrhizobium erythrophlei TaxID=1437360 RepID=UPI0035ED1031
MHPIYRPARSDDALRLFEIRRTSILELASKGMPAGEAAAWAARLTLAGMERKLREFEVWVAELNGVAAGWGAIRDGRLEGLYTAPVFAGRGVGSGLLAWLEDLMRERGISELCAEASSNAREFYLRRGYQFTGSQRPDGGWPIARELR